MRRTLVLFVRAPLLGSGKRRLAREIGEIAAFRFERSMIALLLRRLAKDGRWRPRIAVTPDKARRRDGYWCRRVEAGGQGTWETRSSNQRWCGSQPPRPRRIVRDQ